MFASVDGGSVVVTNSTFLFIGIVLCLQVSVCQRWFYLKSVFFCCSRLVI